MELDLEKLQKADPIKRMVERQNDTEEFSPMDPPDAFKPPKAEPVEYDKLPAFLKKLVDEHKILTAELNRFEDTLRSIQEEAMTHEANNALGEFFELMDRKNLHHNTKEEKILFPILQEKLLAKGEHSKGGVPVTALDAMEEEHTKIIQQASVSFNLFQLAARLPDDQSVLLTLDAAIEQGKALVESMRLHIFREDNIIFSLACEHLTKKDFKEMEEQLSAFDHYQKAE